MASKILSSQNPELPDPELPDRGTHVQIDIQNLIQNYREIAKYCDFTDFICPMVKANAYGHGEALVARALEGAGCQVLGVNSLEEANSLRRAGVGTSILVFGVFQESSVPALEKLQVTPVVSSFAQLEALGQHLQSAMEIHIHFNLGMNRLGFQPGEGSQLKRIFNGSKKLRLGGLSTHLPCGEDLGREGGVTSGQLRQYEQIIDSFSSEKLTYHVFNSVSLLQLKAQGLQGQYPFGVRPGIALYGYPPLESELDLRPVMSLVSRLVAIHKLKKGEAVSYGASWRAGRNSTIGVIPIGYGDGYSRLFSHGTQVLVQGQKCPLVGRVCMDYIMVDLSDLPGKTPVGESVILLGGKGDQKVDAEDLARSMGSISYEVLTSIGERIPRLPVRRRERN